MYKTLAIACAVLAPLLFAAVARATPPDHETFTFPYHYVDTEECGFPIEVDGVFTNTIIDSSLATDTGLLQLHQSDIATLNANGVTLTVNDHFMIFVTIVDGVPVSSKHVGVLDNVRGPSGAPIFFRTGQARYQVVFDPELGYYVDGQLVTRHGIRDDFDLAEFCAAFASPVADKFVEVRG
jgi:hypothetical protein